MIALLVKRLFRISVSVVYPDTKIKIRNNSLEHDWPP
jgi:hypothetical protein